MQTDALLAVAQQAVAAAKKAGATASDALAVFSSDVSASMRNGAPEGIERAESTGVGIRVFVGQASATLSTSDLSAQALQQLAEQAVAIAKVAPSDPYTGLADASLLAKNIQPLDMADDAIPDMAHLQAMARDAEASGLATAGITNSNGGDASASQHRLALVTSHGFSGNYQSSRYSISASLIAGSGETMQRDYDYAMVTHLRDLPAAETVGVEAAARALSKMNPRKLPSQTAPIYFEPRVGRSLLSAFSSAISGSAIARGTSFLKDALNTPVFSTGITVMDDPLRARGLGSRPFDAEGIAGKAQAIVKDGVLTTWIMDTRSANQLGLKTTGHASRGLSSAPHPSTSNFYLQAGALSVEELMHDMGDGFYVTETIGPGLNLITGDYSVGASGFWIEKGVRTYAVSEVTIAGNLREMFSTLIPANDLEFKFGTNVPTIAIPRMIIAGNG